MGIEEINQMLQDFYDTLRMNPTNIFFGEAPMRSCREIWAREEKLNPEPFFWVRFHDMFKRNWHEPMLKTAELHVRRGGEIPLDEFKEAFDREWIEAHDYNDLLNAANHGQSTHEEVAPKKNRRL